MNRPFAEGNERMALAAMVTYLEMNGFTWKRGELEETAISAAGRRERNQGRRVGSVGDEERGEEGIG